jgi:hypothetical protein
VRLAQNPVKTVYSFGTSVTHRSSGVLGTASVAPSSASSRSSLRSSRASWPPRSQVQANPISGAPRQPVSAECLVQPRAARHQDELDHHEMGAEEPGQPAGRRERPAGHAQLREATVACPRECPWGSETPIRARTTPARSADAIPPLPRRRRPRPSPRQRWTGWLSRPSRCPLRAGHDHAVVSVKTPVEREGSSPTSVAERGHRCRPLTRWQTQRAGPGPPRDRRP